MTELKQLTHEVVYRGRVFDLEVDQIEYPSGNKGIREVARHPGGAVAVPVLPDGSVLFVRQYRYPRRECTLEIPAGKLNPGEDPLVAAGRELEEEAGWIAGKLEKLTSMLTTPGFCDEVLHIFLATDLKPSPTGHRREEGEIGMTIHSMSLEEALALVERGEINDAKTIAGLFLAARKLQRDGRSGPARKE